MAVPSHVAGDQIRAVVETLGLDDLEFESIRSIVIEPHAVTVTTLRRDQSMADGDPAIDTTELRVRWS